MTEEASMFEEETAEAAGYMDRESRWRTGRHMVDGLRERKHRRLWKDGTIFGRQGMNNF